MIKELTYPSSGTVPYINLHSRVSWGAIFGGSFIAVAVFLCLGVLGASIGLAGATAADNASELGKGLGIAGGLWSLIAGCVSFYCGGWVAGRLNGIGRISESVIHGVLCWAVTIVLSAFLLTSAIGAIVGGVGGALGNAISAAGPEMSENLDEGRMSEQMREGMAEARRELGIGGRGEQAAEDASRKAAGAGFGLFVMLLLEALAAGLGARSGTRVLRPMTVDNVGRRERVVG